VPKVKRARTVAAPPEELWELVSDPHHLPRWWPSVQRVEDATPTAWTKVLATPRGKTVRADYTRLRALPPEELVWRQEIDESPFERILASSEITISLVPAKHGATRVELRSVQRLRGMAWFGGLMVRRATSRQLDGALRALQDLKGSP